MLDPVLTWARTKWPGRAVIVADRTALAGGVSSARVERVGLTVGQPDGIGPERVDVVLKRTDRQELDALLALAELAEPAIPPVLGHGSDPEGVAGAGVWIVLPWYRAEPLGLVAEIPESVLRAVARIHRAFTDRPDRRPASLEPVDAGFCRRALSEFLPRTARRAGSAAAAEIGTRALALAGRLLADPSFVNRSGPLRSRRCCTAICTRPQRAPARPARRTPRLDHDRLEHRPARAGMFDVAISEPSLESAGARAYVDEWRAIDGPDRDFRVRVHLGRNAAQHVLRRGRGRSRSSGGSVTDGRPRRARLWPLVVIP